MKRKYISILFGGLGLLVTGLSFLSLAKPGVETKAAGPMIDFDGATIQVGNYPSLVCYQAVMDALDASAVEISPNKYEYEGEYYTPVNPCRPFSGSIMMPGEIYGTQLWNIKGWFKWEPLTWLFVKEEGDISYFYSKMVIDAHRWSSTSNDWETSEIRSFLNNEFYPWAFTEEERQAVVPFTSDQNTSHKSLQENVSLITKTELAKHQNFWSSNYPNYFATGYAVAKSTYCLTNENKRAVYYLNSTDNTTDIDKVDAAESANLDRAESINDGRVDCEMGVRPLIAVKNANLNRTGGGGGGGGSVGGFNAGILMLILGIIFSLLGIGGVIAFFILWKRGKFKFPTNKITPPVAGALGGCSITAIVGVCLLFASLVGGGVGPRSSPLGYWSTPEFTLDTLSPDFGKRTFLGLTSDHKVYRYFGEPGIDGTATNFLIRAYDGIGSWSISGNRMTIDAPASWPSFAWENKSTVYYPTNDFGFGKDGRIMNEGTSETSSYVVSGYRWYHSSTVEPTGEPVYTVDVGIYSNNPW